MTTMRHFADDPDFGLVTEGNLVGFYQHSTFSFGSGVEEDGMYRVTILVPISKATCRHEELTLPPGVDWITEAIMDVTISGQLQVAHIFKTAHKDFQLLKTVVRFLHVLYG